MITLSLYIFELFTVNDSPTRAETRDVLRASRQQIQQELGVRLVIKAHKRKRVRRVIKVDWVSGPIPQYRYRGVSRSQLNNDGVNLELLPPLIEAGKESRPVVYGLADLCMPRGGLAQAAIARKSINRPSMLPFAQAIITHELGHVLGADHHPTGKGVMSGSSEHLKRLDATGVFDSFAPHSVREIKRCLLDEGI